MTTFAQFIRFSELNEAVNFTVSHIPGKGHGLIATVQIFKGDVITKGTAIEIDEADWQLIQGTELERLYGCNWGDKHTIVLGTVNDAWPSFKFSNPLEWERVKQTGLVKRRNFENGIKLGAFNFINHSNTPNARDVFGPKFHVEVIATKDIPIGKEITKKYNKAGREAIFRVIK